MPTYEYHCDSCDRNFDVVQSFHDDPLEACPTCGSPVRKVFGSVGIVFKGSGFYKNDSRTAASTKDGDGAAPASDGAAKEGTSSDQGGDSTGSGGGPTPASTGSSKETKSAPEAAPASSGNGKSSGTKESAKS